jgi:hypothetical protein
MPGENEAGLAAREVCDASLRGAARCSAGRRCRGGPDQCPAGLRPQPTIAVVTEAARAVAADVQLVAPGRRHDVVLPRHPETRFPAKPERDRGATDRFSGLLALEVPQAGTWRVSASTPVWIDIADNDRLVASSGFEMQDGCPLIHKVVEFPLQAGRRYWLQLSGNPAATVRILLTRRP